jgi:hypothetical protein
LRHIPGEYAHARHCGHGVSSSVGGLRLLTQESGTNPMAGVPVGEVVGPCSESGASQLLVVLDTCYSGGGVAAATDVATAVMALRPPEGQYVWVGVLASCLPWETARDGEFGRRLRTMIADGPAAVELRRPWSAHNEFLRGDHVCDAVLREWDSDVQRPVFRSDGVADWLLPNPRCLRQARWRRWWSTCCWLPAAVMRGKGGRGSPAGRPR